MTTISSPTIPGVLGQVSSNALTQSGTSLLDQILNAIGVGGDPVAAAQDYLATVEGTPIGAVGQYGQTASQSSAATPAQLDPAQLQALLSSESNLGQIATTGVSPADAAQIAYINQNQATQGANATTAAENEANNRGQGNALTGLLLGQAGRDAASQQANADAIGVNTAAQARRLQAQTALGQLATTTQGQDINLGENTQDQANTVNMNNVNQSNLIKQGNQKADQSADATNAADQLAQLKLVSDAYGGANGVVAAQRASQLNGNNNGTSLGSSLVGGAAGLLGLGGKAASSLGSSGSNGSGLGGNSLGDNDWSWEQINDPATSNITQLAPPDVDLSGTIPDFDVSDAGDLAGDLGDVSDLFDI